MPFVAKDWQDSPSTSTPLSAAALEDLETRVAAYADMAAPFLNVVTDFGAVGDGVADDTTAINNAIAAVPSGATFKGGTVFFPPGMYKCTAGLTATTRIGVRLVGGGGSTQAFGGNAGQAATLRFTGTGSGRFIDARSSYGFELVNIGVEYTSSSFTGTLVDFAHDGVGNADAAYALIHNCGITGQGSVTANCLVSFDNAILCRVDGGRIGGAVFGIRFAESAQYSNAHQVQGVTFDHCTTAALANANQGVSIEDCWFEGTTPNSLARAYLDDRTGSPLTVGMRWHGSWLGDFSGSTDWIDFGNAEVRGLDMAGIFQSGGSGNFMIFRKGGQGISIHGHYIEGPIDLGDPNAGAGFIDGAIIRAGKMPHVLHTAEHRNIDISAYAGPDADNNQSNSLTHLNHLAFVRAKGTNPTVAAAAGAGTGATATLATNSSDGSGTITLNTGTGPSGGLQATLTFAVPYQSIAFNNQRPKLFVMPRNTNAELANVSSQATGLTTVDIRSSVALTASQTYIWDYLVVQ